jgi:hypothetical protein
MEGLVAHMPLTVFKPRVSFGAARPSRRAQIASSTSNWRSKSLAIELATKKERAELSACWPNNCDVFKIVVVREIEFGEHG